MIGTVTAVLKHIKADLAQVLDAPTILALCHEAGFTARRLAAVAATDHRLLGPDDSGCGAMAGAPDLPGRRVEFLDVGYP